MPSFAHRLDSVRAEWRDLGPLRPVAVWVAIVPTVAMWVVLGRIDDAAALLAAGVLPGCLAVAAATGFVLLPPGIAAIVAGYGLPLGVAVAVVVAGASLGGLVGQRLAWPCLGASIYRFMRARPRIAAVQRCTGPTWKHGIAGVAAVRSAGSFPFAVTNLLFSAARTPAAAVLAGGVVAALPQAALGASFGALWRAQRQGAPWPLPAIVGAVVGAAALAAVTWWGRRAWSRACDGP